MMAESCVNENECNINVLFDSCYNPRMSPAAVGYQELPDPSIEEVWHGGAAPKHLL